MEFKNASIDDFDAAFDYIEKLWTYNDYDKETICKVYSDVISDEDERGQGHGIKLMDHAKELAIARGCKGLVLDSGMPHKQAHRFYEIYGFEKSCYGFDYYL